VQAGRKGSLSIYFDHATELCFFMTTPPPVRHRPSGGCHWLCRAALASVRHAVAAAVPDYGRDPIAPQPS
jgi:hypothetical protein